MMIRECFALAPGRTGGLRGPAAAGRSTACRASGDDRYERAAVNGGSVGRRQVLQQGLVAIGIGATELGFGSGHPADARAEARVDSGRARKLAENLLSALKDVDETISTASVVGDWKPALDIVKKAPVSTASKVFNDSSKGLPPNILRVYGGDGGQWLGLRNEALEAIDALTAELAFLIGDTKAGTAVGDADTADLVEYSQAAVEKTEQFIALFDNTELNSTLRGGSYCDFSNAEVCDDVDASRAGKNTGIRYGK